MAGLVDVVGMLVKLTAPIGADIQRTNYRQQQHRFFDETGQLAIFDFALVSGAKRSEEHTSELQSLMRISYAVFCLKKKNKNNTINHRLNYSHHINDHKYHSVLYIIQTNINTQIH